MKRTLFSFAGGVGLLALMCLLGFANAGVAQTVTVDAAMSNQTVEGWGTSLAWFANGTGGWTNNQKYQSLMRDLFSPSQGLGLSYLRFNIGGGNDPKCGQPGHYACIQYPHADPGYEPTLGTYADIAGALNEHWNLLAVGDGSYRIVNVNSGLDLEVNGAATYKTAIINQWQDSGSGATNEHWKVLPAGNGYRIVNVNSGLDMEIDGSNGNIDQYADYPGATNEEWMLIPVSN